MRALPLFAAAAARVTRTPGGAGPGWLGFFRYHGIWSPGVRLMRNWRFGTKLLSVVLLLGLPLLWLGAMETQYHLKALQLQDQRLAGARLAASTHGVMVSLYDEFRALTRGKADPAVRRDGQQASLSELDAAHRTAVDSGVALAADWEAQRALFEPAILAPAETPSQRQAQLSQALVALSALHDSTVERSGLLVTARPSLRAHAEITYQHLPALQGDLARLASVLRRLGPMLATETPGSEPRQALLRAGVLADGAKRAVRRIGQARAELAAAGALADPVPADTLRLLQRVDEGLADPLLTAHIADLATPLEALALELRRTREDWTQAFTGLMQVERDAEQRAFSRLLGGLALALLIAVYGAGSILRVMRGGLGVVEHSMLRMADGNLSSPPRPHGNDEIATTLAALGRATTGLSDLLGSVREGVAAFRQASNQIAEGNGQLSARSRAMAQSLDTLVAGVADYSAQLEACGRQVEVVVQSVQRLRLEAARNRKHMARLQERMQSLVSKTREIGQIVTLIDGIAFRTNILALNASIEASKAGNEVGRGFAVVAMEVRSLAQRTASSAQRIAGIVASSSEDFAFASELATETGRCMAESDRHVDDIHSAMSEVSTLSQDGSRRSATLVEGLRDVEQSTRQNLGMVEQLATASAALRTQGEKLSHKIGRFKLS